MVRMLLAEVARVSREVAETSARSRKTALLAELFAATPPGEAALVIAYLAGRLPQGRPGIGWSALGREVAPAERPTLTVGAVDAAVTRLAAVSGAGRRPSGAASWTACSAPPPAPNSGSCGACCPERCARAPWTPSRWKGWPPPRGCPPPHCAGP